MMIYGAAAAYLGWIELQAPHLLTVTAAYSTLGIGAALAAAGLGHFLAPHKAFLLSILLLAYFHVQVYIDVMLMYPEPKWTYQVALLAVSVMILFISYRGYKARQAAAA